jgi:hypothetical protein
MPSGKRNPRRSTGGSLNLLMVTRSSLSRWLHTSIVFYFLFSSRILAAQPADSGLTTIVIGFVGGFVHSDAAAHEEVQLAARLLKDHAVGVGAEIFPNHLGSRAHDEILRLLDTDHDGTLSAEEKNQARIILYGHSWGASETVSMARILQREAIPVLLTIQVDSVWKPGSNDRLIPANVAKAINFYQLDGLLHGQREILAVDARRTRILGNFQSGYKGNPLSCAGYPWYARLFMKPHIEIECDPNVWSRVESLIRSEIAVSQR